MSSNLLTPDEKIPITILSRCQRYDFKLIPTQTIAARLGTAPSAAHGILTVCNEAMAEAIRALTIRRGIDPRGFALVAFGDAGPVHAGRVAEALGMHTVVVPPRRNQSRYLRETARSSFSLASRVRLTVDRIPPPRAAIFGARK